MQFLETQSCLEDHEVIHGEFEVANFASLSLFQFPLPLRKAEK